MDESKASRACLSRFGGWCVAQMKLELQAEATSNLDIDVLKPVGDCGGLSSGQLYICVFKKSPWTRVESWWRRSERG